MHNFNNKKALEPSLPRQVETLLETSDRTKQLYQPHDALNVSTF